MDGYNQWEILNQVTWYQANTVLMQIYRREGQWTNKRSCQEIGERIVSPDSNLMTPINCNLSWHDWTDSMLTSSTKIAMIMVSMMIMAISSPTADGDTTKPTASLSNLIQEKITMLASLCLPTHSAKAVDQTRNKTNLFLHFMFNLWINIYTFYNIGYNLLIRIIHFTITLLSIWSGVFDVDFLKILRTSSRFKSTSLTKTNFDGYALN